MFRLNRTRIIILAVVLLAVGGGVRYGCVRYKAKKTPPKTERIPRTMEETRFIAEQVRNIAAAEKAHAWSQVGSLESRRSGWLWAKAAHVLEATGAFDDKGKFNEKSMEDPNRRNSLEDMYMLLLRAVHQNRQGVEQIQEEGDAKLRAYISQVDQTLQPYSLNIPSDYDERLAWPMVVFLHGHGGYRHFQGHPAPRYNGVFCLSPGGRGASDYKDLGCDDVLACIEEVKRDYNINENRIYLTGDSMGGTGCFEIGTHYADQFAGIMPVVGNSDFEVWSRHWGWNRPFEGRNTALRKWIQEAQTARAYACNLRNLHSYIISGSADTIVPTDHSRNMVAELRRMGYPVEYREYPGVGHGGFPGEAKNDGMAWMCGWERNPWPAHVTWRSANLKYGKAYWLRMEQLEKPLAFATLQADVQGGQLVVSTGNLLAFSMQRPPALFTPLQPVNVVVDGQRLTLPPNPQVFGWTTLAKDARGQWEEQQVPQLAGLRKCRGCEGPIQEALMAPFVVVVGTQSVDPLMNEAWHREAMAFSEWWKRRNGAPCLVVKDTECTLEMMKSRNLILFGGTGDNAVSSDFVWNIPLTAIMAPLRLKGVDLTDDSLGSMIVYPNVTEAPDRMVVVVSANSPKAAFQVWERFGNWFNWGVYDSKKYFDYAVFDARSVSPETLLLLGWFGTDWKVESGVWVLGNEAVRRRMAPQGYPESAEMEVVATGPEFVEDTEDGLDGELEKPLVETKPRETAALPAGDRIYVSRLMPSKLLNGRGATGWGRSFWGEPLEKPHSLGVRAPVTMEFSLEGKYRSFLSEVCLRNPMECTMAPSRKRSEEVAFLVWGDDRKLAEATVNWKKPLNELRVDVTGVKTLKLEAQPRGISWLHMEAAWLEPELSTRELPKPPKEKPATP